MIRSALIFVVLSNLSFHAYAEKFEWGLGIGGIAGGEEYTDVSAEVNILPVVYIKTENFMLLGPRFGYEFASLGGLEITATGQFRLDGFEADDGDIFEGMEDRSEAFEGGLELEYKTDYGDFSFGVTTDLSNTHKGNEMSVSYSIPFILSHGVISPYISAEALSDDLVDYYYGVRTDEATTSRPVYIGESTMNINFGIQSQWKLGKHHQFIGHLEWTSFGDEIKDSSLVDASSSVDFIFGYVYVF